MFTLIVNFKNFYRYYSNYTVIFVCVIFVCSCLHRQNKVNVLSFQQVGPELRHFEEKQIVDRRRHRQTRLRRSRNIRRQNRNSSTPAGTRRPGLKLVKEFEFEFSSSNDKNTNESRRRWNVTNRGRRVLQSQSNVG